MRRSIRLAGVMACLFVTLAIAGCGEGSGKSASVATATTSGTTSAATTPTAPTTPATTSTAGKPPASKSSTSSTTPAHTTSTPAKPPAAKTSTKSSEVSERPTFGKIKLASTAFKAGGPIPTRYTCDGGGISPPLEWRGVPHGTAEMFLLAIDLSGSSSDAIQWAVAGIPPSANGIPAGRLPAGAVAGLNSSGKVGWGGICGSRGLLHHVGFLFYALKHKLGLKSGFNPVTARNGLKGATLGTGLTLGTYQRP